jgi:hypothetical protein
VLGEGDVGQVIVPDRIVQHERTIAVAPRIAGTRVFFHDERRHAELFEPRAQRDAALSAADDQAVGLFGVAERRLLARARFGPGLAARIGLVAHAECARASLFLLVTLEVGHHREQRVAAPLA